MTSNLIGDEIDHPDWTDYDGPEEWGPMCRSLLKWISRWAKQRSLYSDRDLGFLTIPILKVMVMCSCDSARRISLGKDIRTLIKHFFSTFATWKFNECSVAADCCGISELMDGSVIDDGEALDSDIDDHNSGKRIVSVVNEDSVGTTSGHVLSATGDDNDEVHPHKRHRYELGQIRDIRRFYDVENDQIHRIAVDSSQRSYPSSLDCLDSLSVIDPQNESINLAIKVLESHRKLIVQELIRADHLLSDSLGDDEEVLIGPESEILRRADFRESTGYIIFDVESSSSDIRSIVTDTVEDETWFMVQELQSFYGVMVVPHPERRITSDGQTVQVIVGINFVANDPYSAKAGVQLDLSGPISRVLVRSRRKLHNLEDYSVKLSNKFSVSARIATQVER